MQTPFVYYKVQTQTLGNTRLWEDWAYHQEEPIRHKRYEDAQEEAEWVEKTWGGHFRARVVQVTEQPLGE